jgi:hypothetical protein
MLDRENKMTTAGCGFKGIARKRYSLEKPCESAAGSSGGIKTFSGKLESF